MPAKKKESKTPASEFIGCSLRELADSPAFQDVPYEDTVLRSAEVAFGENPANKPVAESVLQLVHETTDIPLAIAVLTTKYWGNKGVKLGVYFMDTQDSALKSKILAYMNRWRTENPNGANVTFTEASQGMAQIRIARGNSGYWSYLGTDVLQIPTGEATMNLQGFTLNTSDREYNRVVTHETGHTLGFPHEHMRKALVDRLDRAKTIEYFMRTQGWSEQDVIQQVLRPLSEANLIATDPDDASIMTYQLPGTITKDGKPIPGGADINATDYDFVSKIYPPTTAPVPPTTTLVYNVVEGAEIETLRTAVSEKVAKGWTPAGGVSVYQKGTTVRFAQALTRPKPE